MKPSQYRVDSGKVTTPYVAQYERLYRVRRRYLHSLHYRFYHTGLYHYDELPVDRDQIRYCSHGHSPVVAAVGRSTHKDCLAGHRSIRFRHVRGGTKSAYCSAHPPAPADNGGRATWSNLRYLILEF